MKKICLFLMLVSLTVISCKKEEKSKEDTNVVEKSINPNTFKIEVDAIFLKDDELILFWKDQNIAYFDAKNTIYSGVVGNASSQKIVFEFEEGILPNDIRLDISSKKGQSPIVINSIKLSQQDRVFYIDKANISKYFKPNEFIKMDATSGIVSTFEKDQNYDPILSTNNIFLVELEKVLQTTF